MVHRDREDQDLPSFLVETNEVVLVCGAKCPYLMGETPVRPLAHRPLSPFDSCSLACHLCSGYLPQVVRQNAPTHPSAHPFLAVIEAHIQPEGAT
jgi:hypothetical protein